ncbi:MAG TPA: hypothetical protein VMR70_01885 [Flavisolibacter sp.]|nr:hypothetical protein [Flavisolibacter sp.]
MRWFCLLFAVVLFSCSNENNAPDVSGIKMDVSVKRFDRDFFAMDTTQLQTSLQGLEQKYPEFLDLYFKYFAPIREIAAQNNAGFDSGLLIYYRFIRPLADSVEQKFPNTNAIEKGLEENLRYVKHYFPSFKTPEVITSVEGFNPNDPEEIYGATYYQDKLVLSLQMFLGKNYSGYDPSLYPDYLRRRFEPDYIVPNAMRAIAGELYADTSEGASLIEQMIEKGKRWWLMKKLLPHTPDSLITGYTAQQTAALQREEGNIWGVIMQNENLYSIESPTIQTYIGESPFTATLPQGAPGNIGPWIGWRIIEKFAAEKPELSIEQVLRTTAKQIFQEAKYKPK